MQALYTALVGNIVGAALVLDHELRIRIATREANDVLGFEAPVGASAATVLCGDRVKKPLAEALLAGTPFSAVIPRPRTTDEQLRVRAEPVGDGALYGWIVYLAPTTAGEIVELDGIVTCDPRMKELFRIVEKVAGGDMPIHIRGETGAGKELLARAIHERSSRRGAPFCVIRCASAGAIDLDGDGTVFLDDITKLSTEQQTSLLRALEAGVGVRIISATDRVLRDEVDAGKFRADLMFRLTVIPLVIPPFRERPADVLLVAQRFLEELRGKHVAIDPAAEAALVRYRWPGNVRELRNVLSYATTVAEGPALRLVDLPPELATPPSGHELYVAGTGETAGRAGETPEVRRIRDALVRTGGNRERAAKLLGLSRVTLWRRMRDLPFDE